MNDYTRDDLIASWELLGGTRPNDVIGCRTCRYLPDDCEGKQCGIFSNESWEPSNEFLIEFLDLK